MSQTRKSTSSSPGIWATRFCSGCRQASPRCCSVAFPVAETEEASPQAPRALTKALHITTYRKRENSGFSG